MSRSLTVQDACDVIWNCQSAEEIVPAIKVLHQTLLEDRIDSYDPAEAFLAVQGASLRFHLSHHQYQQQPSNTQQQQHSLNQHQQEQQPDSVAHNTDVESTRDNAITTSEESKVGEQPKQRQQQQLTCQSPVSNVHWAITDESLWAVTALACVCIGPAWINQLSERRNLLKQIGKLPKGSSRDDQSISMSSQSGSGPTALQTIDITDGSFRSFTSIMTGIGANEQSPSNPSDTVVSSPIPKYPHIPEVLPAAMLRFATSTLAIFPTIATDSNSLDESIRWMQRQKSIAIAQRYLVLALCCESPGISTPTLHGTSIAVVMDRMANHIDRWRQQHQQEVSKITDWAISGGRELVGTMLAFWLTVADFSETTPASNKKKKNDSGTIENHGDAIEKTIHPEDLDWSYILGVAKAATDLVSAGWRPIPKTNVADIIVEKLLTIADRALSILKTFFIDNPERLFEDTTDNHYHHHDRKEQLRTASSSAAEAISALASLGSHGLIPASSLQATTCALCHLHVKTGAIKVSMLEATVQSLLSEEDTKSWEMERQDFIAQIESCYADTADFLWVLFASQASSPNAIYGLFQTINGANFQSSACLLTTTSTSTTTATTIDVSKSNVTLLQNWDARKKFICMEAGTALRMMSAAFWGRLPDVIGLPHLRIFWNKSLMIISEIASSVHCIVRPIFERQVTTDGTSFALPIRDMLSLALDTVVALRNFVDQEIGAGASGVVSSSEWQTFFLGVEAAVIPWLEYPNFDDDFPRSSKASTSTKESVEAIPGLLERAHFEIESLLIRLGLLLDKCFQMERSSFHSVVPYDGQKKLFVFLLRKAVPHMLDENKAESLGLSVVRAWSKFGLFPFRCEGWTQTAANILTEAFATYKDRSFLHPPTVRLEALRSLTFEDEKNHLIPLGTVDEKSVPSCGSRGSQRGLSSTSSLLTLTEHAGGPHSELLNDYLIPLVKSILLIEDVTIQNHQVVPTLKVSNETLAAKFKQTNGDAPTSESKDLFLLQKYAVRLLGRLIRKVTGSAKNRMLFVGMLIQIALDGRLQSSYDKCDTAEIDGENCLQPILVFKDSVRWHAVRELEHSLAVSFSVLPNIHHIIPSVVQGLCRILSSSAISLQNSHEDSHDIPPYETSILAIASCLAISRLRLSEGSHLALVDRRQALRSLSKDLIYLFSTESMGDFGNASYQRQVAPFVRVKGCQSFSRMNLETGSDCSIVDFEPIFYTMVATLSCIRSRSKCADVLDTSRALSCLCFDAMGSFLRSGFQLMNQDILVKFCELLEEKNGDEEVGLRQCGAVIALGQSLIADFSGGVQRDVGGKHISYQRQLGTVFKSWVDACDSLVFAESQAACRALVAILPKFNLIWNDGNYMLGSVLNHCERRIGMLLENLKHSLVSHSDALTVSEISCRLIVIHAIIADMIVSLSSDEILIVFNMCTDVISFFASKWSFCLQIAVRCLVATIDRMSYTTAQLTADGWAGIDSRGSAGEQEYSSDKFVPGMDFIRSIVSELLVQRMKLAESRRESNATLLNASGLPIISTLSKHDEFALEVEQIEKFQVQDPGKCCGASSAAWLCGKCTLLTFRVGSSSSRYRGWVEIVVRSPTFRQRMMVRLLSAFALKNPEASSIYLTQPNSIPLPPSEITSHVDGLRSSGNRLQVVNKDSNALINAQKALARFDLMLPTIDKEEKEASSDRYSAAGGTDNPSTTVGINQNVSSSLSRSSLDTPSESVISTMESGHLSPRDRSIHGWLETVFDKRSDKQKDIEHALRKLFGGDYKEILHSGRRLQQGPRLDRAIAILDKTNPSNTHKVGLLYAGPRRAGNEEMDVERLLLDSSHCSPAFHGFSNGLGEMVLTTHLRYFSGGLDVSGYQSDGQYTRAWIGNDHLGSCSLRAATTIVVFHVVSLMPEGLNNRKRHVGNDNVLIVFVDKDSPTSVDLYSTEFETENRSVVSGHFGFVTIYVSLMPQPELLRVTVQIREGIEDGLKHELLNFAGVSIVTVEDAPVYVRSIAILADLACRSMLDNLSPASNCNERFRMLCEMNRHVVN